MTIEKCVSFQDDDSILRGKKKMGWLAYNASLF